MHLRSQSFHALAFTEQPKGWQRFICFNLLHLLLMFVALQTLLRPLAGTSQVETYEVAGGSAPWPSSKTPCELLDMGLQVAGTPRGAGAPRNGGTSHQPETVWEVLLCTELSGTVAESAPWLGACVRGSSIRGGSAGAPCPPSHETPGVLAGGFGARLPQWAG